MKAINHKVAFSICHENEYDTRAPEGTRPAEGLGLWGGGAFQYRREKGQHQSPNV